MPIKGLSERRRLPRLGKIHTGIKKQSQKGSEYPVAVDYFVFPEEWLEAVEAAYSTRQPKQLSIQIPVEDEDKWCNQYYRAYAKTRGLLCKGDGIGANCLIDIDTGSMASGDTKSERIEMSSIPCQGKDCPYYQQNQCKEMMMLQFLLPDLPGLGVWQLDTSSINAMLNVNSMAELLRLLYGKVSMIPLLLVLQYQTVRTPEGKQRQMPILALSIDQNMKQMARLVDNQRLGLPAGQEIEEIEGPDEDYPEYIAPDAQSPADEEPVPEIETPPAPRPQGKPEVESPKAKAEPEDEYDDPFQQEAHSATPPPEDPDTRAAWDAMGPPVPPDQAEKREQELQEDRDKRGPVDNHEFWRVARKMTGKRVGKDIIAEFGISSMKEYNGSYEDALSELGGIYGYDWRTL